jgi:hypothetical protein
MRIAAIRAPVRERRKNIELNKREKEEAERNV